MKLNSRNKSFDTLKLISAFGVILLHYFIAKGQIALIVDQLSRFAVPYFFTLSGFLLAQKTSINNTRLIYIQFQKRVLTLLCCWQLVYFFEPCFHVNSMIDIFYTIKLQVYRMYIGNIEFILFHGWAHHLWYFTSLSLTGILFWIFKPKRIYLMLVLAIILYIFGVVAGSYAQTIIGIKVPFNTRNFIFFSALPFTLGALMSIKSIQPKMWWGPVLLLIAYTLHFSEVYYLQSLHISPIINYGFSTFLLGLGVLFIGLYRYPLFEITFISNIGKYALGIYGIHYLVGENLKNYAMPFFNNYPPIILSLAVFIISIVMVVILGRIPVIKKIVI